MASRNLTTSSLAALRSAGQLNLLNDIDSLRHSGIEAVISIPQLVVCGDQSSGKSSVLEAISGIPFPRKDNLCTRFATELILRKCKHESVRVEIIPGHQRPEPERQKLLAFHHTLDSFEQLPALIEDAKDAMGLSGLGSAFSTDVLRIEVSGPLHPHLTIVDLPGLIHSENKAQTETDIETVTSLVKSYMQSSRSIILAVVTAQNDYANQVVLKRARAADQHGLRTLGIITKPDTLDVGSDSEKAFVDLAQNKDIGFSLGWHVLKNRDYKSRESSAMQRDLDEEQFFSQGIWKILPRRNVGICQLRHRLSDVLLNHIQSELPILISEIEGSLNNCYRKLNKLGDSRLTSNEQRLYLSKLSQSFSTLCKSACDGIYEDSFFRDVLTPEGRSKRIRAVVQNQNKKFSEEIRQNGYRYQVSNDPIHLDTGNSSTPEQITRAEAVAWARELYTNSRGRELPGTFNPLLIGELFCLQSLPWEQISRRHLELVWTESKMFLEQLLSELTDAETRTALLLHWIDPLLEDMLDEANEKLSELLADRRKHAITYNHYFTDNVQKLREERRRQSLKESLEKLLPITNGAAEGYGRYAPVDLSGVISALGAETEVDMDTYACNELLDCMLAYYKVAMKTFVDNVCVQVVEASIMDRLPNLFTPTYVTQMGEELLDKIASESSETQATRESVLRMIDILEKGLEVCKCPIGRSITSPKRIDSMSQHTFNSSGTEDISLGSTFQNTMTPEADVQVVNEFYDDSASESIIFEEAVSVDEERPPLISGDELIFSLALEVESFSWGTFNEPDKRKSKWTW